MVGFFTRDGKKIHVDESKKMGISRKEINESREKPRQYKKSKIVRNTDYEISNKDYAEGIEVVDSYPGKDSKLGKNEYFALMVTDLENKGKRPSSDYVDFTKGYLGFERTSNGEIYVSKDFYNRKNELRGKTLMVKISPNAKILELD